MTYAPIISSLFLILSSVAVAEDFSRFSIESIPNAYSNDSSFRGHTKHSPLGIWSAYEDYPMLSKPHPVLLGEGSGVIKAYSHPMGFKSKFTNPKYFCDFKAGTKGELVYVDKGFAAVRVQCPTGQLNQEDDVVFVRLEDLKPDPSAPAPEPKITPEDSMTEAARVPEPNEGPKEERFGDLTTLPVEKVSGGVSAESLVSQREKNSYFSSTEEYLKCYPTPYQENYDKHLKQAIELASKEFTLGLNPTTREEVVLHQVGDVDPIAYMASEKSKKTESNWLEIRPHSDVIKCMVRKESLFDPAKTSPTGAAGLGQQVSENIKEIKCLIYGCTLKDKKGKPYTRRPESWAKPLMQAYQNQVNLLPKATKDYLWTNPRTKKRCGPEINSKEDAYCPIHSLTAMALYQLKLEAIIRKNYDRLKLAGDFEGEELIYVSAVMATGNNAGEGHIAMTSDLENPEEWHNKLVALQRSGPRRNEVGGYFKSMKACIGGENRPMHPKDVKNDKDPDCNKGGPKIPESVPIPIPRPEPKAIQ